MAPTLDDAHAFDLSERINGTVVRDVKRRYDPDNVFHLNHNSR